MALLKNLAIALLIFSITVKVFLLQREELPSKDGNLDPLLIPMLTKTRLTNIKGELDEEGFMINNQPNTGKHFNKDHYPTIYGTQWFAKNLRYRAVMVITASNLNGYGFSLVIVSSQLVVSVMCYQRYPDRVEKIQYDLSPSDWPASNIDYFMSWDLVKYINREGFELMISDDKLDGRSQHERDIKENTWTRAFRQKIESMDFYLEGTQVKRPNTNVYYEVHPFYPNDKRWWSAQEYMYNLISAGKWSYKGEEVDLEANNMRVFGDNFSNFGIFPYKYEQVQAEFNINDKNGALTTFIIQDKMTSSVDIRISRDRVVVENEWFNIDPTELTYDSNGMITHIKTFPGDNKKTHQEVKFEEIHMITSGINLQVIMSDDRYAIGKFTGYYVDFDGERHEIEQAYGFALRNYVHL